MIQMFETLVGHKPQIEWEISLELVYEVIRGEVLLRVKSWKENHP